MLTSFALTLLLSQSAPYVRSRVATEVRNDPHAHCLWWKEETSITWRQNSLGNTQTPNETEFAATAKAFGNWQTVLDSCGSLAFREGSRTELRQVGHDPARTDNENIVLYRTRLCSSFVGSSDLCWREDNCGNKYDCWQYNKATIGLTTTTYVPQSGQILGSDVELNQVSFVFTTVDAPACVPPNFNTSCISTDVENTMTHEIGHFLGLDHSGLANSTMNASAPGGEISKRQIDLGTAAFVCDVYPRGSPSRDCVIPAVSSDLGAIPEGCSSTGAFTVLGGLWLMLGVLLRNKR